MKYLDSNVFLFPLLYTGAKAEGASRVLGGMVLGEERCATASLTLDEVAWILLKLKGDRRKAIDACRDILALPNLEVLDVTGEDVLKALAYMERYTQLKPRDAVHLAVCSGAGIDTIVSDDADLEGVEGIRREPLS